MRYDALTPFLLAITRVQSSWLTWVMAKHVCKFWMREVKKRTQKSVHFHLLLQPNTCFRKTVVLCFVLFVFFDACFALFAPVALVSHLLSMWRMFHAFCPCGAGFVLFFFFWHMFRAVCLCGACFTLLVHVALVFALLVHIAHVPHFLSFFGTCFMLFVSFAHDSFFTPHTVFLLILLYIMYRKFA